MDIKLKAISSRPIPRTCKDLHVVQEENPSQDKDLFQEDPSQEEDPHQDEDQSYQQGTSNNFGRFS